MWACGASCCAGAPPPASIWSRPAICATFTWPRSSAARRLPLSVVVGGHPVDYFGATMRIPGDELSLLACLRGAPMPLAKCISNDIRVPADAEWVLEGYLGEEGYTEAEGPYGSSLAITAGSRSIRCFMSPPSRAGATRCSSPDHRGRTMSCTDTAQLCTLRTEVLVWRALETAIREPVAVYAPPATGGVYNVRIAVRQRVPGEARNASRPPSARSPMSRTCSWSITTSTFSPDEQMEWRSPPASSRTAISSLPAAFAPSRRSFARGRGTGLQGRLRPDHAARHMRSLEAEIPEPPHFRARASTR